MVKYNVEKCHIGYVALFTQASLRSPLAIVVDYTQMFTQVYKLLIKVKGNMISYDKDKKVA
jgi:hypothetical protein